MQLRPHTTQYTICSETAGCVLLVRHGGAGDEEIPEAFISGMEGIPSWTANDGRLEGLQRRVTGEAGGQGAAHVAAPKTATSLHAQSMRKA